MACDDPVQFGQRFDLVDDDLAHLGGVFRGFLRHFEHATAQFVAGGLELQMHLGRHLLHALDHRRKALGGLLEHAVGFLRALLIEFGHGIGGHPAFFFGRGANCFELAADRGRTRTGGFRHDTGDIARALFRGTQRFIEQAREARQPLIEIGGAKIDGADQRIQQRLAFGDRGGGAAVALLDHRRGHRPGSGHGFRTGWTASPDLPGPVRSWS